MLTSCKDNRYSCNIERRTLALTLFVLPKADDTDDEISTTSTCFGISRQQDGCLRSGSLNHLKAHNNRRSLRGGQSQCEYCSSLKGVVVTEKR